jgi:hypothetical protein
MNEDHQDIAALTWAHSFAYYRPETEADAAELARDVIAGAAVFMHELERHEKEHHTLRKPATPDTWADAVNLARNLREYNVAPTSTGVETLALAVLEMDQLRKVNP